jgi:mono/diheme cytochrome c family protein
MRHPRRVIPRLSTLVLLVCLGLPISGHVAAGPVLPDEQSLSNGARLYELYCSECHGQARAKSDAGGAGEFVDYTKLIDIAQANKAQEESMNLEEDWPEWAEEPDPNAESEPDVRTEVMDMVTAEIDKAHASQAEPEAYADSVESSPGGFEPVAGVTNLADPQSYYYGTSEEEVFKSIAKGTGAAMPGWRDRLGSDEDIWDVVNYIRSFWGEEWSY